MGTNGSHCGAPILVADDDPALRALIAAVLGDAGFHVIEAESGDAAVEAVRAERPALLVLDVNLPGLSGYEVCRRVRDELGAELPIVFVSGERTASFDRVAGLMLGADDYVAKPFAPDELLARVHALLRRTTARVPERLARLTPRELEVLTLLADGVAQPGIASRLVISPKTVSTHIERILEKLGVRSRAQAVALAHKEGLLAV